MIEVRILLNEDEDLVKSVNKYKKHVLDLVNKHGLISLYDCLINEPFEYWFKSFIIKNKELLVNNNPV